MAPARCFDVAIVGGGIAGVCLAIGLRKRNLRVILYEQAPSFREIGAGIFFWKNATDAMEMLDPKLLDAYNEIASKRAPPPNVNIGSTFVDGHSESSLQDVLFTLPISDATGVHRAIFLEQIVKLLPASTVKFGKRLENIIEDEHTEDLVMKFADGTIAKADAIIGCDGIKSRVRQLIVGEGHPAYNPVYAHTKVYRGLILKDEADKVVRHDYKDTLEAAPVVRCGKDGHIITFPINQGQFLNLAAFHYDENDWPDVHNMVKPATRLELENEFAGFGRPAVELLKLTKPELDCWGLFDLKSPLPFYNKGRICVVGDAAHATTPHLASGGGFAIEDAAILSELMADNRIQAIDQLRTVFAVYDAVRRTRTQWLVEKSRKIGEIYDNRCAGIEWDGAKMRVECEAASDIAQTANVKAMRDEAIGLLTQYLNARPRNPGSAAVL